MGNNTHLGLANKDDPIYREGLRIFTPIPIPRKPAEQPAKPKENTDADPSPPDEDEVDRIWGGGY
jgi:hypothetical protein